MKGLSKMKFINRAIINKQILLAIIIELFNNFSKVSTLFFRSKMSTEANHEMQLNSLMLPGPSVDDMLYLNKSSGPS